MEQEVPSGNKAKKILIRTGLSLLGILAILIIAIVIVLNTVATPKRITPILLELSKEYIKSDVKCEAVDISFFGTFPNLGVSLQNGSISTPRDTLLEFDNFMIAVNPMAFLFEKKIIIKQLEIENADIYAHVDTLGQANWDIFVSNDSTKTASQDTSAFVMPELNISNIRLRNVNLTYDDLQQDMFVMVDSLDMRLKGNLSKKHADLNLGIRTTGITSYYQGQTFTRALPFSFRTTLARDRILKTLAIEKGTVKVGALELNTNGMLTRDTIPGMTNVDVDFSLNASSLADIIKMIPEHVSDISSKLVAEGKIASNGKLSGKLGQDQYPLITLALQLADGTLASAKHPQKPFIEDFDLDFSTLLDLSGAQPSSLELKNLYLQTASSKLTAKGEFNHLLTKPTINAQAKADINFTQIAEKLPLDGMKMGGQVDFDFSAKCLLDDILASDYGKIDANGVANIKNVKFNHTAENFTFYTSNANIALGSHVKDSVVRDAPKSLLRSKIVLDSLNLNWKNEMIANSSRVSALVTTSPPKDTSSIAPVMVGGRIKNLRLVMGDSIRIRGVHAIGGINIRPRADIPSLPEISGSVSIDTVMGRVYDMAGRISKATFKLKLNKQQVRQRITIGDSAQNNSPRSGRAYARDTTLTRAQRDSIRKSRLDPTTNVSFQIESQETKDLLRNWDISGNFSSKDMSLRTPYFPIPIRMRESDMAFTMNTLNLAKAHMRIGNSDFTLKGEIDGIRRALLFNGKVSAKMTLDADSLDFNELIKAAVTGSEYGGKSYAERDSISSVVLDESQQIAVDEDTTELGIFVVPRNLDVEFNSRIRNARFSDIAIKNIRGRIILRDQAIQLPRLMLNSDIGSASMTMVYKAPNTKGAHLGMELGVKRINVKELIDAMPMIDELAPMLRSFEGVVDCSMTAVTELDSMMNVRLSETTASCVLSGQKLVLLDGETFAEISKMLMFKNKNKNVIDSMSVEMILEDEKLMIFPFQLSMDRYNAAVGGIQNLDMSFDYHITVLKSPIPFKLGLNISGTPDKMKIRLGKAKYKDMFTVAREKDLDKTNINLRKEMDEKLRQSIQDIAGMDLTQPMRRPRVEMPDSLKREYFQLMDSSEALHPDSLTDGETTIPIDTIKQNITE
ncbi:AsmA family protein [Bacteroides sp. 51]|uniref:AsmA family protein n=1 Tax=Bacteroides sp. 51 TaxID=2302938 RepID=UPI0013D42494|nr:AsmA family protein [Bacteroides sp. 51]NDV84611.1 AsmA family protein [Bacteroides sp. 51]